MKRRKPMEPRSGSDRNHIIVVFDHRHEAEQAVRALLDAGVPKERISFFVQATPEHGVSEAALLEAIDHGGMVGVEIGAIAGLGLFAIPGLGPVLGTGAIATALTGAVLGSSFGGVAGALAGAGLTEADAALAEYHLRQGKAVVVVENEGDDVKISALARAQGSLEVTNA